MKDWGPKLSALALTAIAAGASPAHAGDWSIEAVSSTELNIADNRALRKKSIGKSIALISRLDLTVGYAMPDGAFKISTDYTNERYFGEGSADGANNFYPHFGVEWSKTRHNDTLSLDGSFRTQSVTLQKLLEQPIPLTKIDRIPVGATLTEYAATASWLHKINQRNSITFSTNYDQASYSNDEIVLAGQREKVGIDNTVLANSIAWERKINRNTDFELKAGLDWLQLNDASSTDRYIYSLNGEITRRLNARLTAVVGGGIQTVQTVVPAGTEYATDYIFDAGLEYRLKNDTFNWNARYGVNQGALGDLAKQASTSVVYKHQINDNSSFKAGATLSLTESKFGGGLGSNMVFQFTPTYNLALTKDWDFAAGYRLTYQSDQYDATSSTVFMSLTRDFHILR